MHTINKGIIMQMYKGLDIATAKASLEEQQGIPHHLLSTLLPCDNWNVKKYQEAALEVIDDIVKRGKLPVIVGGTMYYIQVGLYILAHTDERIHMYGSSMHVMYIDIICLLSSN